MSKIITAITQWFRSLLWAIAEIFLFLLDCLWKIVLKIGTLNIGGSEITSKFFAVMSICLLIFIVFKLIKIYIKFFIDNEYREKINLSKVLISLSLSTMLITGLPLIYRMACSMTTDAIEHINYWIPSDFADDRKDVDEINMSDVLIQSGRVNLSNRESDLGEEIKLDADFDINATVTTEDYVNDLIDKIGNIDDEEMTGENALQIVNDISGIMGFNKNVYKYFPTWSSIILEILLSIVALFIFAMTAIQIAMRSFICTMKYLLAPYMVATIIDPEDNSFGTWIRSIGGDLIANFCQIYFTYFVLLLCSNNAIQTALGDNWIGIFAKIALFIGGLLAVQEIPNVISQFFGSSGQSMMETFRGTAFMGSVLMTPAMAGGSLAKRASMTASALSPGKMDNQSRLGHAKENIGNRLKGFMYGNKESLNDQNKSHNDSFSSGKKSSSASKGINDLSKQKEKGIHSGKYNGFSSETGSYQNQNGQSDNSITDDFSGNLKDMSGLSGSLDDYSNPDIHQSDYPYSYDSNDDTGITFSNDNDRFNYNQELDAAVYYEIENPEKISRSTLQKELQIRGYKITSLENQNTQVNRRAYKVQMRKNKKKKRGK